MSHTLPHIDALDAMKKYPERLSHRGNVALLERQKVSIVGSRKPNQYTQHMTQLLASKLSHVGVCIVSGAAMGVDAIAHKGAGSDSTIAVLPCGIDVRYPAVNAKLIESIEQEGLLLSQFTPDFKATDWSFVLRNEIVVALGDVLIVTQADSNSGSMRSVEFALAMGKKIYVLPHRIGESEGTNMLLAQGKAEAIYDIESFVAQFGRVNAPIDKNDAFMLFCARTPTYEEAVAAYGARIFEAELAGEIRVENGKIFLT
ncbi:MAG: DNA polymerase III [Sulfuricurvum sp. PC08-66]|nr:MAG: DNA polymerase III [Sulfuricurvum sp. PC08-66]